MARRSTSQRRSTHARFGASPHKTRNLRSTHARKRRLADRIFLQQGKLDVGRREAIVLRLLLDGPVVMGELASQLGIALSTATGIIDRLVERKLVTRTRSASDRRVIVITISAKGRRAHEEWQANRVEFGAALLTALTPTEREALLAMIRKLGERQR